MQLCGWIGILVPALYARETEDWLAQCLGQDYANVLLVSPLLLVTAWLIGRGSRVAGVIWAGGMLTNVYSFVIYSFAVHANQLFHLYCIILGLSLYALIIFCARHATTDFRDWFGERLPRRTVAVFLLVVAGVFYALWLSQSVPAALNGGVSASVSASGLLTNPVHALDYSFYLPLMVISGVLLLRGRRLGYVLAPIMLVFILLTSVNIISLTIVSISLCDAQGLPLIVVFGVLSLAALGMIVAYCARMHVEGAVER